MVKLYNVIDTRTGQYYSVVIVKEKKMNEKLQISFNDDDLNQLVESGEIENVYYENNEADE